MFREKLKRLRACVGLVATLATAAAPAAAQSPPAAAPPRRPNIVLILVDDAALMDFGTFGGEARTPNIDRLAKQGAMFTGYHTSPLCSPSRAMLLTGLDNHRAGVATIEEILPPSQRSHKGYGLHIEPGAWTIAERLRREGYRTLMAGKWHLGHGPGDLPNHHGFDRSLALDASGADNWAPRPYMPYYRDAPWFEDGKQARMPDSYYSSDMLADRLIRYIDEAPPGGKPFFGYLAFQAVHIPVQAPGGYADHYKGQFDQGWSALRAARIARARELGLLPQGAAAVPLPQDARDWNSLSAKERKIYARTLEVYSGMLEAMDASVGRLMARLEARGELANTLFVVTSDNGPEPTDPVHQQGMNVWMALHGYHWRAEGLGGPGSLSFIGREWALALSAPSRRYKFYASEGGLRTPLVMSGPGVPGGVRVGSPVFVTDVTPTLADFAGAAEPAGAPAMDGRSLRPLIEGRASAIRSPDEAVGVEVSGNSALFRGDYKIVRDMPPVGDGKWRLYDLVTDPGETQDLAAARPELMTSMLADYAAYEKRVGVQPLPPGYNTQKQLMSNALARQLQFARGGLVFLAVLVAGGLGWWLWRRRRRAA